MGISSSGTSFPSAYCLVNRRREIALLPLYRRGGNKACHLSADCNTGFYGAALSPTAGAVPNADRASLFGGYCKIKQVTIDLYGVCGLRAAELFKHCFIHNRKPPLIRLLYQRRFLFMNPKFIIYLSTISSYLTSVTFPISFARSVQPLVKPVLAKR